MADYYTNMSSIIDGLTRVEAKWLVDTAEAMEKAAWEEEPEPEIPEEIVAAATEYGIAKGSWHVPTITLVEDDDKAVWIRSDENFLPDALAVLIMGFLRKFRPDDHFWTFEYSFNCSKLRTDGFGGGACYVEAKEMSFMSTGHWMDDQAKEATEGGGQSL